MAGRRRSTAGWPSLSLMAPLSRRKFPSSWRGGVSAALRLVPVMSTIMITGGNPQA